MKAKGPSTVGAWIFVIGLALAAFLTMGGAALFDEVVDAALVMLLCIGTSLLGAVLMIVNVIRARGR